MKIAQIAGIALLASLFAWNGYSIIREPEKQADKYFKQYADFRIWSNKSQRSYFGGKTLFEFPGSEIIKPYKVKGTYIIAYLNILGALGMVIGEQSMVGPLIVVHVFSSFLKNNPFPLHPVADQATYDNKMRCWLMDMVIAGALLVVLLDKHPLVTAEEVKSYKVNKSYKVE